jgi:uncharacterized membrane protein YbhN (UPF0104 family)
LINSPQRNGKTERFCGVDLLTRTSILILKLLVVVVLGWVFWPQFRWYEFVASMARTSTAAAVAVLALFGLQVVMAALRWRWILRQLGYPLTAGESIEATGFVALVMLTVFTDRC